MNRPEERETITETNLAQRDSNNITFGYNQACDEWEIYHEQEIKELEIDSEYIGKEYRKLREQVYYLPNEKEIVSIYYEVMGKKGIELEEKAVALAKAIAKRIGV